MDNEEIAGVKFSEFPAEAPDSSDEIVGLHSGNNARFSISNLIFAARQGLASLFVPLTRRINGKALSSDISLTASDVGARANDWMPTAAQVGARPDTWTPSASDVGAVPVASVGVAGGVPNLDELGRVPQNQLPPYPTVPAASTSNPQNLGTASPGVSNDYSRADHVHDMPSASDVGAAPAKSVLRFTSVAVSAGTSQQIISISNADITADHVLARIEWADPRYITVGFTWTTGAGSFTLSGTCTAATTANVLLVRKGN